jgi:hypothetical protein
MIVAMIRLLSVALAGVLAQLRLLGLCSLGQERHYAPLETAREFSRLSERTATSLRNSSASSSGECSVAWVSVPVSAG